MWLKWPAAIVMLAALPGALYAAVSLVGRVLADPWPVAMFLAGFGLQCLAWWLFFRRTRFSLLLTFEHELTHALFAWATLHRVTGLRATAFRGGQVTFLGAGNWLITIAPYFFPTLSVLVIVVSSFLPSSLGSIARFLIGMSFAYHLTSTLHETHPGQTDLQQVGKLFCVLFLPTANLVTIGVLLGFIYGGWSGSAQYLMSVWQTTWSLVT